MRILLLQPACRNSRFGLSPFFCVEPLGLEYLGSALLAAGHETQIIDARLDRTLQRSLTSFRPDVVGASCTHLVDVPDALQALRNVKRLSPKTWTVVGGHAVSLHPPAVEHPAVDILCKGEGETAFLDLLRQLANRQAPPISLTNGSISNPTIERVFEAAPLESAAFAAAPLPARQLVARYRTRYHCLHKVPLWAVETARGCPFRCSFCSVALQTGRRFRVRDIANVIDDLAMTGPNVFIVDDLFFYPADRSMELARALERSGIRKSWILAQCRPDVALRNVRVLEAWRSASEQFDIFFGFEAPTDEQLEQLGKDSTIRETCEAVAVARRLGYGVTGNFVVDPDWDEQQFEALWALVDRLRLDRAGYTILTPLPGTPLFERLSSRIVEIDWSRYDMSHLLFEPRLGRARFFQLFAQSWQRNVLRTRLSRRGLWRWFRGLGLRQQLMVARALYRSQAIFRPDAYLAETFPAALAKPWE
jgi:radical SAM superfamily enzyme YgiQ (UPF0313 family)